MFYQTYYYLLFFREEKCGGGEERKKILVWDNGRIIIHIIDKTLLMCYISVVFASR